MLWSAALFYWMTGVACGREIWLLYHIAAFSEIRVFSLLNTSEIRHMHKQW